MSLSVPARQMIASLLGWEETYQELGQVLIWDVGKLLAVEFGDDELFVCE